MQSTSLGVAKVGNSKLDFMAKKALEFTFWGLKTFLDVIEISKPKKNLLAVWTLKGFTPKTLLLST